MKWFGGKRSLRQRFWNSMQYIHVLIPFNQMLLFQGKQKNKLNFKPKQGSLLNIQKHQYGQLNQYFFSFLNSRSIKGKVPGQHLNFVTGSKTYGKSYFIQSNIKKFKEMKDSLKYQKNKIKQEDIHFDKLKMPEFREYQIEYKVFDNEHYIMIKFNFQIKGNFGFNGFLHYYHQTIISHIMKMIQNFDSKEVLLSPELIREIIFFKKCPQYLHFYIKKAIFKILEDQDSIYFSDLGKQILDQFNQKTKNLSTFSYFYEQWDELINIFATELKQSKVEATLRLILSAMKQIQHEYRPKQFKNSSYESGIETTCFLFQILNFLCGVGQLNKNVVNWYFQQKNLNQKSRQLDIIDDIHKITAYRRKTIQQIIQKQRSWILKGNHIDVGMFFLNFQNLRCFNTSQFKNFFDHLLIQLANKSSLRSHFPVMIQLQDPCELKNIQSNAMYHMENPTIIQIPGIIRPLVQSSNLIRILDINLVDRLFPYLGVNPSTWNQAIQNLSQGTTLNEIMNYKQKTIQKQRIKFQAKINKIFCLQQSMQLIDKNKLNLEISLCLSLLKKLNGVFQYVQLFYDITIFDRPAFNGMKRVGLISQSYYLTRTGLVNMRHLGIINECYKQQSKGLKHLKFLWWKWFEKGGLICFKRQIKYIKDFQRQQYRTFQFPRFRDDFFITYYYGFGADYYKTVKSNLIDHPNFFDWVK